MDVEAHGLDVSNLLKKGQYIIPDYQREFDWTREELDDFFEDISDLKIDEPYFIGHMVFEGKFNSTVFNVVDGQQRITTITILLCVIRDLLFELDNKDLANGLNLFIFQRDMDNIEFPILKNEMPYPVLQKWVQSVPENKDFTLKSKNSGEIKIKEAYEFFKNKLKKSSEGELLILRNKILALELIFVAAGDTVNAHSIFMTLNATGKNLTAFDLIKNQIYSRYPKQCHIKEPDDTWKKIIINIRGDGTKVNEAKELRFLNKFWASRYKKVSNHKLFREFTKEIIKPNKDVKVFLESLYNDSIIYNKIIQPEFADWKNEQTNAYKIFYSLNAINNVFGVEVANSFILALIREYFDKKISNKLFTECLESIEKFHFIFNAICSSRSSGLDQFYSMYARKLGDATSKEQKHIVLKKLIDELVKKTPEEDRFKPNFTKVMKYSAKDKKRSSKDRKLVEYLLKRIEAKLTKFKFQIENVDLEHIYPETANISDWPNVVSNDLIVSIGNITLLDKETNSKIGNKSFLKKKEIVVNESPMISAKDLFKNKNEWNTDSIKKREADLASIAYSLHWK